MKTPIIEMRNITKTFPGVVANDKANLSLYEGEVHALLGENGAGKSTLMSILTGNYRPDSGDFFFKGKKVDLRGPRDSLELGIGMVHQHFRLVEPLSVAENILLSGDKKGLFMNLHQMKDGIMECADQYGLKVDTEAKIWQLSIGEQQRVEIVKHLYQGAEVLILDEPTAVLTPQEVRDLFSNLHKIAEMGKTIVFITHKLHEVMNFADRITVLRSGKTVASLLRSEADKDELTKLMVGRAIQETVNRAELVDYRSKNPVLELKGVCAENDRGLPALTDINLSLYPGEIVCVAGVAGNGQRELGEVIAGLRQKKSGDIVVEQEVQQKITPRKMIEKKIAFIPEDRLGMGLLPGFNMYRNLILKSYRDPQFSSRGFLKEKQIAQMTQEKIDEFQILSGGAHRPVKLMSGGNQQKLLLSREVSMSPSVIVATYPVRGLDVGATEAIHNVFIQERAKGTSILLISEDLDEIFNMADRIIVLCDGKVMGTLNRSEASYEQVGKLMLGETSEKEVAKG